MDRLTKGRKEHAEREEQKGESRRGEEGREKGARRQEQAERKRAQDARVPSRNFVQGDLVQGGACARVHVCMCVPVYDTPQLRVLYLPHLKQSFTSTPQLEHLS